MSRGVVADMKYLSTQVHRSIDPVSVKQYPHPNRNIRIRMPVSKTLKVSQVEKNYNK